MKKILKEPLLHFLLIGVSFFILYSLVSRNEESESDVIKVNSELLDQVTLDFEKKWNRKPENDELGAVLKKRIEEEIFFREALRLNLNHNDETIRSYLAQKMKQMSVELTSIDEPDKNALMNYYERNKAKYLQPLSFNFYQVYFSTHQREDPKSYAKSILKNGDNLSIEEMILEGDQFSMPNYFEKMSLMEISRKIGKEFSVFIKGSETQKWVGPISSNYGVHIVYISEVTQPYEPEFVEIEGELLSDYMQEMQLEAQKSYYNEILNKYEVKVELDENQVDAEFLQNLKRQFE